MLIEMLKNHRNESNAFANSLAVAPSNRLIAIFGDRTMSLDGAPLLIKTDKSSIFVKCCIMPSKIRAQNYFAGTEQIVAGAPLLSPLPSKIEISTSIDVDRSAQ